MLIKLRTNASDKHQASAKRHFVMSVPMLGDYHFYTNTYYAPSQ